MTEFKIRKDIEKFYECRLLHEHKRIYNGQDVVDICINCHKNIEGIKQNQRQCPRCLKQLHKDNIMHTCTPHKDWKGD
jgi:predicted amidophosphoribosyltransferase